MVWNIVIAVGLFMGSEGWRKFGAFRAGIGLLLGPVLVSVQPTPGPIVGVVYVVLISVALLGLLYGDAPSRKRIAVSVAIAVVGWSSLALRFGWTAIPELRARWEIERVALPLRQVVDSEREVRLDLPTGWLLLPKDNPIVQVPGVAAIVVNPTAGVFATLAVEEMPPSVSSVDQYLSLVVKSRQEAIKSLVEVAREPTAGPQGIGVRAVLVWNLQGQGYRGFTTAYQRGTTFYLLSGWAIEALHPTAKAELVRLEAGLSLPASADLKLASGPRPSSSKANEQEDGALAGWQQTVVRISTLQGVGSGFFVAPNLIATNAHVVGRTAEVRIAFADGQTGRGSVVYTDRSLDFAFVWSSRQGSPLAIRENPIQDGEGVIAVGFPQARAKVALSTGVVRAISETWIRHDALVAGGSSGGPLVDSNGQVLGINTLLSKSRDDRKNETDRVYAVKMSVVVRSIEALGRTPGH